MNVKAENTPFNRLLSFGLWAFFVKSCTGFITIALAGFAARVMTPEDLGVFFVSFSSNMILGVFVKMGLDHIGVKLIGEALVSGETERANRLTTQILYLVSLMAVLVSIILFFAFKPIFEDRIFNRDISLFYQILFSFWVVSTAIQMYLCEVFRAYQKINHATIFSAGTAFGGFLVSLFSGAVILFYFMSSRTLSLDVLMLSVASGSTVVLIIQFIVFRNMLGKISKNLGSVTFTVEEFVYFFKQSFPIFVSALCAMALLHLDQIILGLFNKESEVAIYANTSRVVKLVLLFSIVSYEVLMPVIVEFYYSGRRKELERVLRLVAGAAAIPSSIALAIFTLAPEFVLTFLFGSFYAQGAKVMIILSLGQFVVVWAGLNVALLNMTGYQKVNMYLMSSVSVVAIILCFFMSKYFGKEGVAFAIASSWSVSTLMTLVAARRLTGIWTHMSVIKLFRESTIIISALRK